MVPSGRGSSPRMCVVAGLIGFWPQAVTRTTTAASAAAFPRVIGGYSLPARRITQESEEFRVNACLAGTFWLLQSASELAEGARRDAKRLLVARWEAPGGHRRLMLCGKFPKYHPKPVMGAGGDRDDVHLLERHELPRPEQKPLHPCWIGVIGHEELERVMLVVGPFEDLAGRVEPLRE